MKQSKLLNSITNGQGALNSRAGIVVSQLQNAQENLISGLKMAIGEVDLQILQHTDLAPESTTSLKPGIAQLNAADWVVKLQELKVKKADLLEQLEIAEETNNELFGEQLNETTSCDE